MDAFSDLARNLWAGFKLAVFADVERRDFRATPGQAAGLTLLMLAASFLVGYASTDESRSFYLEGFNYLGATLFGLVAAVFVVAWMERERSGALALYVVLLSVGPVALFVEWCYLKDAVEGAARGQGLYGWTILSLCLAWCVAVPARAIGLVYGGDRRRVARRAAAFCLIILGVGVGLPSDPIWYDDRFDWSRVNIWKPSDDYYASLSESERVNMGQAWRLDVETIYYEQPKLIDAAFKRLAPQRPGVVDLYIVGFAGYAYQNVFRNEVGAVSEVLEEKFDARRRSIALVNNMESIGGLPLANLPNLRSVLERLGRTIDPEEDIVFLYMTSHGSEDHYLSTDFGALLPNAISTQDLKQALDDSGIKWRIVFVSACFAGGFVDEIGDERTLVMSSAGRDRETLLGSEDELSLFDALYFQDALQEDRSFERAFRTARERVTSLEEYWEMETSQPQIRIGAEIRARLAHLEGRLDGTQVVAERMDARRGRDLAN